MKCLKVDEYIKRTASVRETELLFHELEVGTSLLRRMLLTLEFTLNC